MIFDMILVLVLVICLITDIKEQMIYNKVIFPALITVIPLHFIINGFNGLKFSLLGLLVGFSLLLIPYFLGGIGAGDVKLLALIGAIKGTFFVLNTALYMAVIGGFIALVIILFHKETLKCFKGMFIWVFSLFQGVRYKLELPTSALIKKYPYGVAIVGGAVICLIFKGAWIV
ncbi:A24 family peptidase [Oceanirhabdus sp. W0125-5]|uniref:A24 family peptidase n=1 Tax=Oceanirhabdus sp. W0125-5 TaxID=2999116 RepID=UPI0022F2CDBD|nr:prepilin peptidase [Oceanirhabdus sp. W0125-5]WBW95546.1 prepilin peptidase [Oceanirhabdus sp. W0125-5]